MKGLKEHGTGLKEYVRKRKFSETSEPKARIKKTRSRELSFVIQKHDATRLHYDFRLEMEGVLKSWAVPKGLPTIRGEKHLAVHVEDHPMDYASFEGTIPPGNYGAGTVMVWDVGTYQVLSPDPIEALNAGKIHLELTGKKLKGEWTLVRLKQRDPGDKDNWLIFKTGADHKPIRKKTDDQSIVTGRSMNQIANENTAQWISNRSSSSQPLKRKVTGPKAAYVEPMKCKLLDSPPAKGDWIYELKFDGFRAICVKNGRDVELFSRSHKSLNGRFPEIAEALRDIAADNCVIDGEIVALDAQGKSSFQLLQNSNLPGARRPDLSYYAFDLLHLNGENLQKLPLLERKKRLKELIENRHDSIRYSSAIEGDPAAILEQVRKLGMEGLIAKQTKSLYEPGLRSGAWVKIKCINEQEFVIGGFTEPKGSRDFFGAVLVGYYDKGKLFFASKVGTGFTQALLRELNQKFAKLKIQECPFVNLPERRGSHGGGVTRSEMRRCTWLKPELVCQVSYTEWTNDGHLRHPAFLGLRDDKKASEVVREKAE